jgi:hypothetical protein
MADDFAAKVKAFRDKALGNVTAVVHDATIGITAALVERTPVDITPLRANWNFGAGTRPYSIDETAKDESAGGADTVAELAAQILESPVGGITYVNNAMPYMPTIEYGLYPNPPKRPTGKTVNGFSTQAPAGVIGVTAIGWEEEFVKPAIEKLKI